MDNNMMQMMMQMMMQNQQIMSMMMNQMMGPNSPMNQTVQEMQTANLPTVNSTSLIENGEVASLKEQIAALQHELENAKREAKINYEHWQQQLEITKQQTQTIKEQASELGGLKQVVKKAEMALGKSIKEVAKEIQELSGDDYYEQNKADWEDLSGKEKHDKIKAYRDLFADGESQDNLSELITF